jgi:hypothetical protein
VLRLGIWPCATHGGIPTIGKASHHRKAALGGHPATIGGQTTIDEAIQAPGEALDRRSATTGGNFAELSA